MSHASALRLLTSLLAALLCATPVLGASRFDPKLRFRMLATEHFIIYFHGGEERLAARLAVIAEDTYRTLGPRLGTPVQNRTHVVIVDQSEFANGWATPLPYNTIAVSAAAPAGSDPIGHSDDWLRLVFAHEYAHIVHLDRSGGWSRLVRSVFGRTPLAFPNLFLPIWQIEGIATFSESALTNMGRRYAGDFRAIEREAARQGKLEPIDRVNGGLTSWPDGHAPYAYGLGFHSYLARTYGEGTFAALADRTARRVPFFVSGAFPGVYGKGLGELWRDYQTDLRTSLLPEASPSQLPAAATEATRVTRHGYSVFGPRFLPRACADCPWEVVYSVRTPHGFPSMNAVALDGSRARHLTSRYLGSTAGVHRDVLVFDQQDVQRAVGLYSDLYFLDLRTREVRQITEGQRLLDPDLSPDGTTIVAVREGSGRRELVTIQAGDAAKALVLLSEPDTQFNAPRWSPDGTSIAVERQRLGRMSEIVIVNAAGTEVRVVASAANTRFVTPAWLSDGRALLVAVARAEEPFNLYELNDLTANPTLRRLTNLSGGATWPDVSPDGTAIAFVGYTTDGSDLFTLPYPTAAAGAEQALNIAPDFRPPAASLQLDDSTVRTYNPLPTLKPTSWEPLVHTDDDQLRIGGTIGGQDVLAYHAYAASATWRLGRPAAVEAPGTEIDWDLAYAYNRWQPTLFASLSAETSFVSAVLPDRPSPDTVAVRSRQVEAGLVVPFRRVRVSHRALASVIRDNDRLILSDAPLTFTRTAARAGWSTSSARLYGFSVSPEHGVTVGVTTEHVPESLGSGGSASSTTIDFRAYLPAILAHHVVAIRGGMGISNGDATMGRTFQLGGASPAVSVLDFDADAFSLLRGFDANAFAGRRVGVMNAEYRWPLAYPERGFRTWPVFLHALHAALFTDVGHAWSRSFRMADLKVAVGAELSADIVAAYSLPLTITAGAAWGHDGARRMDDRATLYVRIGRAF